MRKEILIVTTDASGSGTATSVRPVIGEIREVRYGGTALNAGGSADYTFVRGSAAGGTILAVTNQTGPWSFSGTALANGSILGVPCVDHVKLTVAQCAASATDSLTVYYEDED